MITNLFQPSWCHEYFPSAFELFFVKRAHQLYRVLGIPNIVINFWMNYFQSFINYKYVVTVTKKIIIVLLRSLMKNTIGIEN
jgi:hypothetical protein